MVVTVSSSYSSPDFKAHLEHSTSGSYRIPRKPPPAIDISERYPSPDPADPFAPLWVLRNRTSSNLMNGALRVEDSQETLDNPLEQRHIVYPTPPSTTTSNGGANRCALGGRRNSYSRTSPPASPSPTKGYKSKPGAKMAHYKTYSQLNDSRTGFGGLNTVGTLQAFPRIVPLGVAQLPPHIDFASPKPEQRPWSPNIPTSREASASPQSRIDPANFADSTWSSDSDDDEDDDEAEEEVDENASINPSAECKPSAYISSPHRHQSSQSISNPIGRTADSRSRSSSASPRSMKGSSPKMLTKFLFPRKMSVLNEVNLGGGRAIPGSGVGGPDIGVRENLASRGLTGRRTTASTSLDYRHVTKSSISAPQPFVLPKTTRMGVREPSANIMPVRGRVDTTYKNGLDLDGSLGQKTTNDASHDMTYTGIEKIPNGLVNGLSLSRTPVGASDSPPPINELNDKPDSTKTEHDDHGQHSADKDNGKRCLTTSQIPAMTALKRGDTTGAADSAQQAKKRPRFPMLRSLSVPLPSNFTEHRLLQHNCKFGLANLRSRMSSGPQLLSPSSLEPSMHTISNTSIVNISISGPTFAPNLSVADGDELEGAFASPRRAPLPPGASPPPEPADAKIIPAEKGDERHTEKSGSSSYHASVNQSSRAASPVVCSSNGCSKLDIPIVPLRRPPSPPIETESTSLPTEWALPTQSQITQAASLQVIKENGKRVTFGSLFSNTRTIVVFIRHFWCPLCQDYMSSLKSIVKPEMLSAWPSGSDGNSEDLKKRLVSFVVIGNGAFGMIHKYKQMFGLPFEVYTDPAMAIYKMLGMGRDGGEDYHIHQYHRPQQKSHHHQPSLHVGQQSSNVNHETNKHAISSPMPLSNRDGIQKEKDKSALGRRTSVGKSGSYVKHGLMSGMAMVVVRAIKVGMPVWEKGGDINQLGGEFIFGPGLTCSFAHRMQTTKGHAPIEDVLKAAGISVDNPALAAQTDKPARTRAPTPMQPPKISLIPPTPPPKDYPPRRRLSSLKTIKDALTHSRATSPISSIGGGGKASFDLINEVTDDEVDPVANALSPTRKVRRFSTLGVLVGMMSQEEEEKWMEHRQKSLDRLKEKKNMRRGLFSNKTQSVQSIKGEVFDGDSKFDDIEEESNVAREANRADTSFAPESAWDGTAQKRDMDGSENDHGLGIQPASAARHLLYRRSFDSATDSASAYSLASDNLNMAKGSYIFMEDDGLADDEAEPRM